jgi:hypothetical protein
MANLAAELLTLPLRAALFGAGRVAAASLGRSSSSPGRRSAQGSGPRFPAPGRGGGDTAPAGAGARADLYRGIAGSLVGGLAGEALSPRNALKALAEIALHWPDLVRLAVPGRASRAAWVEFRNKVEAFRCFATADTTLRPPRHGGADLASLLWRLEVLDVYQGLWTTEGLGYYHTTAALERAGRPTGLLAECGGAPVPAKCLVPLHTGMGLAFASRCLTACPGEAPSAQVRRQLDQFLGLCQQNARPGYGGACVEALGLVARLVRPRLVPVLDEHLLKMDGDTAGRLWHGVGRGLYFSPANFLPCSSVVWPALRKARCEPPHELGRLNAVAGFAWAATLVNVRDPDVLEMLLSHHGPELSDSDAFANGVRSAAIVWHDWAPGAPYWEQLCRHRPKTTDAALLESWGRHATSHCGGALSRQHGALKRQGRLGDLFEYRLS